MRFLFGIFTGAALTLLIATTTNAPTSPVVAQINAGWQALIHTTGDLLFRHSTTQQTDIPAPRQTGRKTVGRNTRQRLQQHRIRADESVADQSAGCSKRTPGDAADDTGN